MIPLLDDFSYRIKVPISLTLAILISGVVITGVLIARGAEDLRDELYDNAQDVGGVLVNTLVPTMRHDDLWQAYQILNGAGAASETVSQRMLVVIDLDGLVYVSNNPRSFPVNSRPAEFDPEFARLIANIKVDSPLTPQLYELRDDQAIYVTLPLMDDGVRIGLLIMGYPKSLLTPKLYELYWRVTLSTLAVIALLIPVGWQIGKRMVAPLMHLSDSMALIGKQPLQAINYEIPQRKDEIGRLGMQFQELLQALSEKERFEIQMIASERLAAIGRVAAGVAHEINNPLGGMMNAINTFKHYGQADPLTEKTASMLERGLEQIRDTVSVLLVQARPESHPFTQKDLEDIATLLKSDARKAGVTLNFSADGLTEAPLPSTPIRQILINLGLNAIRACTRGKEVVCQVQLKPNDLVILTENPGAEIPSEQMGQLFEPFGHDSPGGNGLGLWVTYQIVQQLKGEIAVLSEEGITRFHIHIPISNKNGVMADG